jgi:glucosamine-6-phosphate deaminase
MQTINGVQCKVVKEEWDVYFDMAMTMLEEILRHNATNERTVMIVPVGPTDQYPILAELINRLHVSLRSVYFFNMDEYLSTTDQRIPDDDTMSFHGRMKREFYDRVSPELVMPENQRIFPEPGGEAEFDRMLEELGGADACFGGLGINGHVAFNEAAETGDSITAEEFANLPTRVIRVSRETRTINAYGYKRGDLQSMPDWGVTVGMKAILKSKRIYIALNRPWQHGPFKHALFDAEQPQFPATLLRRNANLFYCLPEAIMRGIITG